MKRFITLFSVLLPVLAGADCHSVCMRNISASCEAQDGNYARHQNHTMYGPDWGMAKCGNFNKAGCPIATQRGYHSARTLRAQTKEGPTSGTYYQGLKEDLINTALALAERGVNIKPFLAKYKISEGEVPAPSKKAKKKVSKKAAKPVVSAPQVSAPAPAVAPAPVAPVASPVAAPAPIAPVAAPIVAPAAPVARPAPVAPAAVTVPAAAPAVAAPAS